jgi:SAM-dependent methyltransferase
VEQERNERDVADRLMALVGSDPFADVTDRSPGTRRRPAPCSRSRFRARVLNAVDSASTRRGSHVLGIDADPSHVYEATNLADQRSYGQRVTYTAGYVADVLPTLEGPFDMIHDDAWFAKTPDHLDSMIDLLRPGGLLTMVNWCLLVDALSGQPRNDWAAFAGPNWADDTKQYAELLAGKDDLDVVWVTRPPIAFATKRR